MSKSSRTAVTSAERRWFLAGVAAMASAPLVPWQAFAQAAAPISFKQRDVEITVVSDGELTLPLSLFGPEQPAEELAEIAKRLGWTPPNASPKANHALIRTASDLILVDTGSGAKFQPTAGKLVANLKAAGIEATDVTKVIITHAHLDHLGGNTAPDGTLLFANAAYYVGGAEWDFWMDPDLLSKMPAAMADFVTGAQRELGAIKDKVTMIKPGDDIVTGVRALDTAGHTPGHLSLEIAGGEGLIITADASTNEIVAFEHPDWKFAFDAIPDLAIKNRKALIDRAATDKIKLLGYHWTGPGVGFAEKKDAAWRFVPAS